MKSVFDSFGDYLPADRKEVLRPFLSTVEVIELPRDEAILTSVKDPSNVVVIVNGGSLKDITLLMASGFEQFVQRDRPDFVSELLASSLMVARPKAFLANPIPFFFNGFNSAPSLQADTNFEKSLLSTKEKAPILAELETFLSQNNRLAALTDLALQVADEMIMNAFFSGPVDGSGNHIHQNEPRSNTIKMLPTKPVRLFAAYSDYRVIIGCQDLFGSMDKRNILNHMLTTFETDKAAPRAIGAGAGLGFKYMLENAANFYLFCQKHKQSLVACGFLLKGFKANLSSHKHVHISIR